jgi:hypothetical protein
VGFEVNEAALGQVSSRILRNSAVTVILPVLHIHSFITGADISQQLTASLERTLLSFRRVKLKSNFVELTPGKREDVHFEWNNGVRISNNGLPVFTLSSRFGFFSEFSKEMLPSTSG